ncbi:MAG: tyrosine-type recombinase/integrase [Proteobacteria bacterium]|nr:tyrosine-type recombinase/integrase [Pseudomonadota bacterium]
MILAKLVIPHTMRHTAITEMSETGAEARTIQAFSGHKSKEMVWRYTHARDQRINEALDRFDKGEPKVERIDRKKRPRS